MQYVRWDNWLSKCNYLYDYIQKREVERWRDGEMERWRDGEVERWRDGEMERWRDGEVETIQNPNQMTRFGHRKH
jgi:hypothetical protein